MELFTSRSEITKIIEKIANSHSIKNYEITKVSTNQKGEGFLSQVFMVTIEGAAEPLHVVFKVAFKDTNIRDVVPIRTSFENESFFYQDVAPTFSNFGRTDFLARCLDVSLEEKAEVISLENLSELGFQVFDKKKVLDDAHVSLIFRTYGRYHALSFALKDQNPEEYRRLNRFHNIFSHLLEKGFDVGLKNSLEVVNEGLGDGLLDDFKKYLGEGGAAEFKKEVEDPGDYPVLLHGDCWSNNMMFKYKNGKPDDIRLLDFQLCREGSPVCDLSYCLYTGASKEIFDNLEKYLLVYHQSLSKTLTQLGSDPKLYPFEALKDDWRKHSKFGLLMGVQIIKIKLTDQEDVLDFTDLDGDANFEKYTKIKYDEETFKERTRGLVEHLKSIDAL